MCVFVMTSGIVDWFEDEAKSKRPHTLIHSAHEAAPGGENSNGRLSFVPMDCGCHHWFAMTQGANSVES